MTKSALLFLAAAVIGCGPAAAAEAPPGLEVAFERYVLPNGLRVILHVDRSSPLVAVNVRYHVGSKDEAPGRTGFAHLFEHLMFMGSKNAPYPSFDAVMEAWGGTNNGSTTVDRTNYYELGPSNLLETFLWLEADRLATLPEVITDEELGKQRKVVQNERRQSYENRPYGKAQLLIPEALYPAGHPYRWPTIGSHADLEAARVEDVRAFFRRFYVPANAALVIAGDFDPAVARRLVEKYFGWQPAKPAPPKGTAPAPVLAEDRRLAAEDRVQLPRLYLSWHSPATMAAGDAELDLAAAILADGKASRLYRRLVFEDRLAQDVSARQDAMMLGGRFSIVATAKPGQSLDRLEQVIDEEVGRLRATIPGSQELEGALNRRLASFYRRVDTLAGRAELLNQYEHVAGDPGAFKRHLEMYRDVTRRGVSDALARVTRGRRVALRIVPESKPAVAAATAPDAAAAPAAAPAPAAAAAPVAKAEGPAAGPVVVPAAAARAPAIGPLPALAPAPPGRFELRNGLPVISVPRRTAPVVSLRLVVRSGADADPPALAGLAAATADMLDEGAGERGALEIAEELERLGAQLSLFVSRDGSELALQVPAAGFHRALAIVGDVLMRPRFAAPDWKRVQNDRVTALVQRRDSPEAVAALVADRALYGDQHPYGRPTAGYQRTMKGIGTVDLRGFYRDHWRPDNATLVVAGNFDPARLEGEVAQALGGWNADGAGASRAAAAPEPAPARAPTRAPGARGKNGWRPPRFVLVDKPDAPQTVLRLVGPGVAVSSPDRPPLEALATLLGGSFTSRLNSNLRERNGYTYGASASFSFLRQPGPFSVGAAVFTKVTDAALGEMFKELGALRTANVKREELAKVRALLQQDRAEALATTEGAAGLYGELALYGLPLDEPQRFTRALTRVDVASLRRLARRSIDPAALTVVAVGDRAAIQAAMQSAGLPSPELRDADGERVDPAPAAR